MLDIAAELDRWQAEGRTFAVATVVSTSNSAPRPPGAALAVDAAGEAVGSVSGGCVEGAVYELCRQVLGDGVPVRESFGYSDEDAFAVGLTCGGTIEIAVRRVEADGDAGTRLAVRRVAGGRPAALATVIDGPAGLLGRALAVTPAKPPAADGHGAAAAAAERDGDGRDAAAGDAARATGSLGDTALDRTVAAEAAARLDAGATGLLHVGADGTVCGAPVTVFVHAFADPPRLLVFGAVDFAAALVRAGKLLGHHVTVCDARPVFTTRARFPDADDVVVDWPHRYLDATATDARTAVCVLTHDPKFDLPLLRTALRRDLGYVGAMGSRRTHRDRLRALRDAGVTEHELRRLRSPIGLDLGARTPAETAVSIVAEIVATRRGGSGRALTGTGGPIHHDLDRRPGGTAPPATPLEYQP